MKNSQLRRLAKDYAAGRLDYDEYTRERGELIDAIVAGDITIESSAESTADFGVSAPVDRRSRVTPIPLIIGACVVIGILWAFLNPRQTTTPATQSTSDKRPWQRVSAARALVEDFLGTRDWSGESLANFRDHWNALTPNEQAEAREAPWFRRLAEALGEEINAHKALAEFDGSGLSTTTGRRLAAFGEFLGIDAEIPDASAPEPAHGLQTQPEAPLSGSQWLAAQRDEDYTLQLFAVNHLDKLEHLTTNHPDVPLYLLAFEGREPHFRLLHGIFPSEEQARLAYQALPAELRGQTPDPNVRRIGDLRDERRSQPTAGSASSADPAIAYTLQIFASSNKDNVDRLVSRYQALDLRVHISDDETARYRVLYGHFDSRQAAQDASARLPATMLEEVGAPLLRESSEFH
jgi:hypothetical protein